MTCVEKFSRKRICVVIIRNVSLEEIAAIREFLDVYRADPEGYKRYKETAKIRGYE